MGRREGYLEKGVPPVTKGQWDGAELKAARGTKSRNEVAQEMAEHFGKPEDVDNYKKSMWRWEERGVQPDPQHRDVLMTVLNASRQELGFPMPKIIIRTRSQVPSMLVELARALLNKRELREMLEALQDAVTPLRRRPPFR
jgi:hypothetical protein